MGVFDACMVQTSGEPKLNGLFNKERSVIKLVNYSPVVIQDFY